VVVVTVVVVVVPVEAITIAPLPNDNITIPTANAITIFNYFDISLHLLLKSTGAGYFAPSTLFILSITPQNEYTINEV
jgi:hypothetical protein